MTVEEKEDMSNIFKPGNQKAPYNAVRYDKLAVSREQREKSEKIAANVAKKCQRLRDRSTQNEDDNTMTIGGITIEINI